MAAGWGAQVLANAKPAKGPKGKPDPKLNAKGVPAAGFSTLTPWETTVSAPSVAGISRSVRQKKCISALQHKPP